MSWLFPNVVGWLQQIDHSSKAICLALILSFSASYWYTFKSQSSDTSKSSTSDKSKANLTALQQHILFWDRDNDNIIWPHDVYNGFRALGFNIPFSITSLLIPFFFSYPTRLGHSLLPDPCFRIYLSSIQKAKHGSDSGVYDLKGNLRMPMFEEIFEEFDCEGRGSLGAGDLWNLWARNRVAADPAGWTFAAMEWSTTWLLLQKDGRVQKDDLLQCYDGTLFWKINEETQSGKESTRGFGVKDFLRDPMYIYRELKEKP